MTETYQGYYLPSHLRFLLSEAETTYDSRSFVNGRPCAADVSGAVTVAWPRFTPGQWDRLTGDLRQARRQVPQGIEFWERFQSALDYAARQFADRSNPLFQRAIESLPGYTGYSQEMIQQAFQAMSHFSQAGFPAAFERPAVSSGVAAWVKPQGLPGWIHFEPQSTASGWFSRLRRLAPPAVFSFDAPPEPPELILGYSAGNVPGAALLIALLGAACTLASGSSSHPGGQSAGGYPPAVLVRNSRREPIFTPLVLEALEQADPDLLPSLAVLTWDYEDAALQHRLLRQADLVIAAAGDDTIAEIQKQIETAVTDQEESKKQERVPASKIRTGRPRFQAHGHKVSFAVIRREMLVRDVHIEIEGDIDQPAGASQHSVPTSVPLLDAVALACGLDSILWDQHGCLSARVHFVEEGGPEHHSPADYAASLAVHLDRLAHRLPRGAWPLAQIHDRFDHYKQFEGGEQVQVFSRYDDPFLVALDRRPLSADAFRRLVNDCMGRVIVVRPVADWMDIPRAYLSLLPAANLQSLSVASRSPVDEAFLRFALACSRAGVTAIRTAGRGAFPHLAYSWDGFIPLDLVRTRPPGYFTTIEFDDPYPQLVETIQRVQELL